MSRLIEAVKCAEIISEKFNIPLADLVDVFAEIPTAEVVEVKHGKWMKEGCGLRVCSECNFEYDHAGMPNEGLKYCPECGAKMDGKE